MENTLYVTGVVIANGITDSDGDLLDKKDIKTIFTKYVNRETDTMHKNIENTGVDILANWITESDTICNGKNVPTGSWMCTAKVENEKLIKCINQGKLRGFSLGSVTEDAMTPKYWFINKSMNYRDLEDIEEVVPLFISFVDKPANQFDFEIMTYETYINKNMKCDDIMSEEDKEMISVSALEKIKDIFSINKAENDEIVNEESAEESADESVDALFDTLNAIKEQNAQIIEQNAQIIEAITKAEDEEESVDEEEEKAEDDVEEVEKAEDEEESTEKDEDEIEKTESEDSDVEINKRATHRVENQTTEPVKTFNQRTGRDMFGRKIKR